MLLQITFYGLGKGAYGERDENIKPSGREGRGKDQGVADSAWFETGGIGYRSWVWVEVSDCFHRKWLCPPFLGQGRRYCPCLRRRGGGPRRGRATRRGITYGGTGHHHSLCAD